MKTWSIEHRVFVYNTFIETGRSVIQTQRRFRNHFNVGRHGRVPRFETIMKWVNNFQRTGSLRPGTARGGERTVRTPENIERVRQAVEASPRRSAVRHARALRMSNRSVRRILHLDLHFHPFKLMVVQQLQQNDYGRRFRFAETMVENMTDDIVLIMSDEAHFHLSGVVNKQNFRYWASENPRQLHEKPLHSDKLTVWCGISRNFIIGPYFFQENGRTVTVNTDRYLTMLREFFLPQLRRRRINLNTVWFQQDGATCHTSRAAMEFLRQTFPGRLISLRGDVEWPPRSPDLSPCDYFLWGYLKARVYINKPRTLEALSETITQEIRAVPRAMLQRSMDNFSQRLQECMDKNGQHLTDVIFRT